MKNTKVLLLLSAFLMTFFFAAQAHVSLDNPGFSKKVRSALAKDRAYQQLKASKTFSQKQLFQVEQTLINFGYYNTKSRISYLNHMAQCSVDKGVYTEKEAQQLKAIVAAANSRNYKMTQQAVNTFASSATSEAGKAIAPQLKELMKKVAQAKRNGGESLEGFWKALGAVVGAVVGAIVGGVAGGIGGAIAGALGGMKLGEIIGGAMDNLADEMGNGVWAGRNGDENCTPPFGG